MSDTVFEAWSPEDPSPGLARRLAGRVVMPALGLALLFGAVSLAATGRYLPHPPPEAAPPRAVWQDIVKPVRVFAFEAPAFAGTPLVYTARRHVIGGGREDLLALGTPDGNEPAIRLRLFRRDDEPADTVPLYAALAHEAAQTGLAVARGGLPDLLPTRFGPFEIAEIALVRKDGVETACSGFRLRLDAPALSVTGLACGGGVAALSRQEIGCLIERLDVASAREDRDLIDFFARSELSRNRACVGMRLGPDGLHAPWLDDKPGLAPQKGHIGHKPATTRKRVRRR